MRSRSLVVLTGLACLVAVEARAQLAAAGSDLVFPIDREREITQAVERARWRLGPLRVAPWVGLRDVGLVDDGTGEDSELTATGGAGLRAYLPLGENVTVAAHALPEYRWWQEREERRGWQGRYGVGAFAFLNRLRAEGTARRVESDVIVSPELFERATETRDTLSGSLQLRLGAAVAAYTEVTRDEVEIGGGDVALGGILDQEVTRARGGLRYLLRGDAGHLGAGLQTEDATVGGGAFDRSHEGTSTYLEANLEGNRVDLHLDLVQRSLEPVEASLFPPVDELTGRGALSFEIGWRLALQAYGGRHLGYSLVSAGSVFLQDRLGAGVRSRLGRDGMLQLFWETGENRYLGLLDRVDDVDGWGASVEVPAGRRVRLAGFVRETRIRGPIAEREVTEVGLNLVLGASLGEW